MKSVKLYNDRGETVGEVKLDPELFDVRVNRDLLHQAVVTQEANARTALAHVKTRGEVRGGGKKPWRQKGTGRARHGSIRSPLWSGGGVTFGPRNIRNFSKQINKKAKRKALLMALSDKAHHNRILVLEKLEPTEYKTKYFSTLIEKLPVKRKVLIVIPRANAKVTKSIENISSLNAIRADSLNVVDVLRADYLVFAQESFAKAKGVYVGSSKK